MRTSQDRKMIELAVPLFPPTTLLNVCEDFLILPTMIRSTYKVVVWRGCLCQAPTKGPISLSQGQPGLNCRMVTLVRGLFSVTFLEQVLLQDNLPYVSRQTTADFRRYRLLKERK